ncbi:MAG: inositol monophosphatase [Ectothiorhodospiraceae bacterium]|nr:inositol monophosphatase [Ectothiorhodospiraceae bacterium]
MDSRPISPALDARFHAAVALARDAGHLAHRMFRDRDRLVVESKGLQDRVSAADRAVEALIRDRLTGLFPDDGFLGEESGARLSDAAHPVWVVDPIDGTDCFVAGIPVWCVSIALVRGTQVELGAIYDPNADELFAFRRGAGATLDGRPLRVAPATALTDGVAGLGTSQRVTPERTLAVARRLLEAGGMFQRNGSGALMIAYVAAGRLIGYFEEHINAWDAAAAIGLVREAGGWTNDFLAGDGLTRGNEVLAAAPGVAAAWRAICAA